MAGESGAQKVLLSASGQHIANSPTSIHESIHLHLMTTTNAFKFSHLQPMSQKLN